MMPLVESQALLHTRSDNVLKQRSYAGRLLHHERCQSPAVCSPNHKELGEPGQQQSKNKQQRFSHDRQQSPLPKWVCSAPHAVSIRVDCNPESPLIDSASMRSSSVPGGPPAAGLPSPAWPATMPYAREMGSLPAGSGSAPGSKPGGAARLQRQAQLDQVSRILFPEAQEDLADWIPDFLDDTGLDCCVPDLELLPEHLAVPPAQVPLVIFVTYALQSMCDQTPAPSPPLHPQHLRAYVDVSSRYALLARCA